MLAVRLQERHLYSRTNFILNCAAALAEWRQLLSAWILAALVIGRLFSFLSLTVPRSALDDFQKSHNVD